MFSLSELFPTPGLFISQNNSPNIFLSGFKIGGLSLDQSPIFFHHIFQTVLIFFLKKISCNNNLLPFSSKFNVPWIIAWTFQINTQENKVPSLVRQFRVKWWDTFNISQANTEAIPKFLTSKVWYPAKDPQHLEFLTQLSKIQALLAATSSKEDYVKLLEDVKYQDRLLEQGVDEGLNPKDFGLLDPNDFFSQM